MNESNSTVVVANLTASPFLGGPERQMAGLASAFPARVRPVFLCLAEGGKSKPFADELDRRGQRAILLKHNYPHLIRVVREVAWHLRDTGARLLLAHGYKADIIGLPAARLAGIPIVMVSRGWTSATRKVRFYEILDRMALRRADHVICVSEGQAAKVRKAHVAPGKITVIRNAIEAARFDAPEPTGARRLHVLFPHPMRHIVLAVGRLSPEKGFDQLIEAARSVCAHRRDIGFVLVGDGPLLSELHRKIDALGLHRRFILAGFRSDVDQLLPHATCLAQSSHTEGMPNVILEAMAASVPVVATNVGGTPELVVHNETGLLIPPRDTDAMAVALLQMLDESMPREQMGAAARQRVETCFSFSAQAREYQRFVDRFLPVTMAEPISPAISMEAGVGT